MRGLAEWSPRAATREVLNEVSGVLDEYRSYLPMTARQIFYRLVGSAAYPKTEQAYTRLLEYLNRARRSGMIPWTAIRDDGFDTIGGGGWSSPSQVIASAIRTAENYERDHQETQPHYTEIWVEAAGMMPQVAQMVRDFDIPIYSSGGFNSTTSKYESAQRMSDRYDREDRPTRVLHVGDYDPSGVAIIDSLADDILSFLGDLRYPATETVAHFTRLAVVPVQIEEYELPGAPAKATDNRAGFADLTVQAEALSPPQLEALVLEEVRAEWDEDAYDTLLVVESQERESLITAFSGLGVAD